MPLDPLTADFERMVRTQLAQLARQVNLRVPVNAAGEQLRSQVAAQVRAVETTLRAKVPVDPEGAAEFRRKLAAQVAVAERTVRANIRVDVDSRGLSGGLLAAVRQLLQAFQELIGAAPEVGSAIADAAETGAETFGELAGSAAGMGSAVAKAASSGAGALSGLAGSAASGVAGIAAMAAQVALLTVALTFVAGAALAVGGAVTAGVAGLPVVLTSLVAPIAAIALGFDGIKRAAGQLTEHVTALKDSLSATFERELTPVFDRLHAIFPVLETGLNGVAVATSQFASGLVDVVTSEAGLQNIKAALAGVGVFLNAALPGAQALLGSMLEIAGTSGLYQILGETVGGLSERFAGFLDNITTSRLLTESLVQLRDVLFSLSGAMGELATNALEFFTTSAPGFTAFLDSITGMFERVDFSALGESFGGMLERAGAALEAVPPETWQMLADAIGYLAEKILVFVESGGLTDLINLFTGVVTAVGLVIDVATRAGDALNLLSETFDNAGLRIHEALEGVNSGIEGTAVKSESLPTRAGGALDGLSQKFDDAGLRVHGALQSMNDAIRDKFFEIVGHIRNAGERAWAAIRDAFERARMAVVTKVVEIVIFVQSLPGKIRGALGSLGGLLVSAGRELIDGLLNGIRSAFGRVQGLLRQLTGMLPSWKGPLSRDRSILYESGQAIIDGLVRGLESQFPAVRAALGNLTAQVAATPLALGPPTSARNMAGGSPGPGWRQAEDGSWVRPGFYPEDRPAGGGGAGAAQTVSIEQLAAVLNAAQLRAKGSDLLLVVDEAGVRAGRR